MCVREKGNRLPRGNYRPEHNKNGPGKGKRGGKLADTTHAHGGTTIPWVYRLLSILRPKLLENRPTTPRPYEEDHPLALAPAAGAGIPGAQKENVFQPR